MSEPFIGQIIMFAGNYAPRNWAFCDGQLLPIANNTALFSILGTVYGGDGQTTFALPDLRGRAAMHAGQGAGLTPRPLGQRGGVEQVSLSTSQMPSHNHTASGTVRASSSKGTKENPEGAFMAITEAAEYAESANAQMADNSVTMTVTNTGGSQPHTNMQPYTVVNYIIALYGIYPSRS